MVVSNVVSKFRTVGAVLLCALATGCMHPSSGAVPGDDETDATGSGESDTSTLPVLGDPDDPFPEDVCLANFAGKPPEDSKCRCEFLDCEGTEIECECSVECFASPPPDGCAFVTGECNDETGLCSVSGMGVIGDFIGDTCSGGPIAFCRNDDGTMDHQQCNVSQCEVDILNVVVCSELTQSECEEAEFCSPIMARTKEVCQANAPYTFVWVGCMGRNTACSEAMTCGRRDDDTDEFFVFSNLCLPDGWTSFDCDPACWRHP